MKSGKAVSYKTEKIIYRKELFRAWLLMPFGVGYIILKRIKKQIRDSEVLVYNDCIVAKEGTILLSELKEVRVVSNPSLQKLKLSSVQIVSDKLDITVYGILNEQAEHLGDMLSLAIKFEDDKKKLRERSKGDYAEEYHIGGLEHMNSLVGLWQQGLISDEDFFNEQKKFKKE